jgi:transposase-like protein
MDGYDSPFYTEGESAEASMAGDFKWRHFEGEIILWAVRWYCKYGISYRELEEMLEERGIQVDHTTIYRWVQRYAPEIEKRLRWRWWNWPHDMGHIWEALSPHLSHGF